MDRSGSSDLVSRNTGKVVGLKKENSKTLGSSFSMYDV
jgi:hypothetical protein